MRCQKRVMQHPRLSGHMVGWDWLRQLKRWFERGACEEWNCKRLWLATFCGHILFDLERGQSGSGSETRRACVSVYVSWSVVYGAHCEHNGFSRVVFYVNLICMCIWAKHCRPATQRSPFACRIAAQ